MDFQEAFEQVKKQIDVPIPLKECPLKNVWHFVKENGESIRIGYDG
jgi:hypothetical protein